MGNGGEHTAKRYRISREEQDEYAKLSYTRSAQAMETGVLRREIVPVSVPSTKKDLVHVVEEDQEIKRSVLANNNFMVLCLSVMAFFLDIPTQSQLLKVRILKIYFF